MSAATPLIVPRPPSTVAHGAPVFDLVTAVSDTDSIWTVRDAVTGKRRTSMNARAAGEDVREALLRRAAAWIDRNRGDAREVLLRVHSIELREVAAGHLAPAGFIIADPLALAPASAWAERARAEIRSRLAARFAERVEKRVLYAASDGSAHPVHGMGAAAWITADGSWQWARASSDILSAEVSAIVSFAKAFDRDEEHGSAVLFVDSQQAIRAVHGQHPVLFMREDQGGVRALLHLVGAGRLELLWVRGHAGHALNETADRLALCRHRALRAGLPVDWAVERGDRIVENALPALRETDWDRVASSCRESAVNAGLRAAA